MKRVMGSRVESGLDFLYVNLCSFSVGFLNCSSVDTTRWLMARVSFTVRFLLDVTSFFLSVFLRVPLIFTVNDCLELHRDFFGWCI